MHAAEGRSRPTGNVDRPTVEEEEEDDFLPADGPYTLAIDLVDEEGAGKRRTIGALASRYEESRVERNQRVAGEVVGGPQVSCQVGLSAIGGISGSGSPAAFIVLFIGSVYAPARREGEEEEIDASLIMSIDEDRKRR